MVYLIFLKLIVKKSNNNSHKLNPGSNLILTIFRKILYYPLYNYKKFKNTLVEYTISKLK